MTAPMMARSTYAESAIASDVAHMACTAGMAPACGEDSSVSPARVSSGLSASRARAANQEVIAFPISQLTSRNPQLVPPLLAAAGAGDGPGLAAGEAAAGGEDGCAASRTGVVTAVGAVAGRAGGRGGAAARVSAAAAAARAAVSRPASTTW